MALLSSWLAPCNGLCYGNNWEGLSTVLGRINGWDWSKGRRGMGICGVSMFCRTGGPQARWGYKDGEDGSRYGCGFMGFGEYLFFVLCINHTLLIPAQEQTPFKFIERFTDRKSKTLSLISPSQIQSESNLRLSILYKLHSLKPLTPTPSHQPTNF